MQHSRDHEPNDKSSKYQWDVILFGLGIVAFIGAPLLVASYYPGGLPRWFSERGWNVIVHGPPGRTERIVGGAFSLVGLVAVLVGLPSREKKKP